MRPALLLLLSTAPFLPAMAQVLSLDSILRTIDAVNPELRMYEARIQALPIAKPPFYAVPLCAGITYTMGGIAIDPDGQVLRSGGGPLDGVYAVGATTGGLEGGPEVGYVGGLIKAVTFGIRAAERIARQAKS